MKLLRRPARRVRCVSAARASASPSREHGCIAKPPSQKVMLLHSAAISRRARRLAERKGLPYQTYMKLAVARGSGPGGKTSGARSRQPAPGGMILLKRELRHRLKVRLL